MSPNFQATEPEDYVLSTYGRVESAEMANDNNNSANLPEKIKEDMRKSGFPLEFHVLNVCSTKDTGRMPNLRYEFENPGTDGTFSMLAGWWL